MPWVGLFIVRVHELYYESSITSPLVIFIFKTLNDERGCLQRLIKFQGEGRISICQLIRGSKVVNASLESGVFTPKITPCLGDIPRKFS